MFQLIFIDFYKNVNMYLGHHWFMFGGEKGLNIHEFQYEKVSDWERKKEIDR